MILNWIWLFIDIDDDDHGDSDGFLLCSRSLKVQPLQTRRSCAPFFSSAYDMPCLTSSRIAIPLLLLAHLPASFPSITSFTRLSCHKMCPSHLFFLVWIVYNRVLVLRTMSISDLVFSGYALNLSLHPHFECFQLFPLRFLHRPSLLLIK